MKEYLNMNQRMTSQGARDNSMSATEQRLSELDDRLLLLQKLIDLSASLQYESLLAKSIPKYAQLQREIQAIPTADQIIQVFSLESLPRSIYSSTLFSLYHDSSGDYRQQISVLSKHAWIGWFS